MSAAKSGNFTESVDAIWQQPPFPFERLSGHNRLFSVYCLFAHHSFRLPMHVLTAGHEGC